MRKKAETKKKGQPKKKVQAKKRKETKFIGKVTKIRQKEPATVIEWPRSLTHVHTYGMLSPFFEGLEERRITSHPLSKQELPRKTSLDPAPGPLPGLPYGDDLEALSQSSDRKDLYLYRSRLCRNRHRTFHSLLASRCGDPGSGDNPEKLFVIWKALYWNEGQG